MPKTSSWRKGRLLLAPSVRDFSIWWFGPLSVGPWRSRTPWWGTCGMERESRTPPQGFDFLSLGSHIPKALGARNPVSQTLFLKEFKNQLGHSIPMVFQNKWWFDQKAGILYHWSESRYIIPLSSCLVFQTLILFLNASF